ncbi:MAG: type II/IV secretion system protein [PVC group bacterium]|nr:type II/IV secretion system protein [PVC group bacterium]
MLNKQKIISEFLTAKGILSLDQLKQARQMQARTQQNINSIFKKLDVFCDENLGGLIVEELGLSAVDPSTFSLDPQLLDILDPFFANRFGVVPLQLEGGVLTIAFDNPLNFLSLEYFSQTLKYALNAELIKSDAMEELLKKYYPIAYEDISAVDPSENADEENGTTEDDAPVIQLVSMLISDAYRKRASDIHVEPMRDILRIRYRIDGILQQVQSPVKKLQASVISRVKLMAGMNIAEKRLPQDGRIRTVVDNREFDLRVSTLPSHYGESVVLRILDRRVMKVNELGFSPAQIEKFKSITDFPNGIILVTGPTGSGKSTTLYAVLSSVNRSQRKILTVEDPVEYQISGINQVQVKPKIGLSFAKVLRSMLRQAPDIIMVGEIRDLETANISVQSALTGHLIFSTLHTNDASSAITRLIDMGIKPYLVAATIRAILAQRLIRLLCPNCKELYSPPKDELKILELSEEEAKKRFYRPKGCPKCAHTGYLGRSGIFELLVINEEIRQMTHKRLPSTEIREKARSMGMMTLKEHAVNKVLEGLTSFQEVVRVTQSDVD